uniref:GCV_T domain-containing protein n=1 Tax=Mesocestoides corti TaxID=53468 RepID=A0A5K3FCI4_MESCO
MLNFYNIRKKVRISEETPGVDAFVCVCEHEKDTSVVDTDDVLFNGADPRAFRRWCWRILLKSCATGDIPFEIGSQESLLPIYTRARYRLALPEGADELKACNGFPLEANADLCNGVSFSKGCYIGQELTARSHFVGVIRRRIAPILFESPVDPKIMLRDSPIYRIEKESNKVVGQRPVGWVRAIEALPLPPTLSQTQHGLALLRLAECASAVACGDRLWVDTSGSSHVPVTAPSNCDVIVKPFVPSWWPQESKSNLPTIDPYQ